MRFYRKTLFNVSSAMIYFSERTWDLNFTDQFLKRGNYCKS
ncbi:hypothetical protein LEP1GSC041_0401 [Leptospira noguchii str. 2006001870]|nr:hypothetical protein LEP1GSC041_0401 [Leptospira noguchii str. 2006001870]